MAIPTNEDDRKVIYSSPAIITRISGMIFDGYLGVSVIAINQVRHREGENILALQGMSHGVWWTL